MDESRKGKVRYCARCQNHGISEELKGHKRHCPYRNCKCSNCEFTQLRQSVMVKVGHLGRRRSDDVRSTAGAKRPRDSNNDEEGNHNTGLTAGTSSGGSTHRPGDGLTPAPHGSSSLSSVDDSSSTNDSSANAVGDVTSSAERVRGNVRTASPAADNPAIRNGTFSPASFSASPAARVSVPAPAPKSDREGLSTISSIILGFCGNDAKKAVECIEKAYKELLAIANPELKQTPHSTPPGGLHLPRPPDVSTAHLSLSGHTTSHLPLGLGSMMTLSAPDPGLLWTTPPSGAVPAGSLSGLVGEVPGSSLLAARNPLGSSLTGYHHHHQTGLFGSESIGAHLLKNPFLGSSALL